MTALDQRCEVCGYQNHYVGVASTSIPLSIAWCGICLGMGVEPTIVFSTLPECETGDEPWEFDPKKCSTIPHFNREEDRYYLGENPIPVQLKDGRSFDTRGSIPDSLR